MTTGRGAAVILAAGTSTRFGSDKRVAEIHGEPMILRSISPYLASIERVVVAIRPQDPIATLLSEDIETVEAEEAHLGMGHSLAAAVNHVGDEPWMLVGLADMPWIQADTIEQLVELLRTSSNSIVRPIFKDTAGHPVGFTQSYFTELGSLKGDMGARELIQRNKEQVQTVSVQDSGILRDVDEPSSL